MHTLICQVTSIPLHLIQVLLTSSPQITKNLRGKLWDEIDPHLMRWSNICTLKWRVVCTAMYTWFILRRYQFTSSTLQFPVYFCFLILKLHFLRGTYFNLKHQTLLVHDSWPIQCRPRHTFYVTQTKLTQSYLIVHFSSLGNLCLL